jgi:aryl-alcohol dehydrogenase-like predicted oxidoreductase
MKYRQLGSSHECNVSAIGLGCMGMSVAYGPADEGDSLRTLDLAADLGINLLDTADVYGLGANERLIGKWLRGRDRSESFISTKFGLRTSPRTGRVEFVDTTPKYAIEACHASLERLRVDAIDLYYVHRRDPLIPIEDTVGAMAGLIKAGKVRHLGLSEVSAQTLRRAHAAYPISAVQVEYSLFTRGVAEGELLSACRDLGISLVAYSPLGRGMLTGAISSRRDLSESDNRLRWPRFSEENIRQNLRLVDVVRNVAIDIGCTPAQAALGWLLHQGSDILPVPGTKRTQFLTENVASTDICLSRDHLRLLEEAVPEGAVAGERYPTVALDRLGH